LGITDDVRAMRLSVGDDPWLGARTYRGGQLVVLLQAPFEAAGVGLEEPTGRLRERAGRPRAIEVEETFHEPGSRRESNVFSSRKVAGDLFGCSMEPAKNASHHAAIVSGLVGAVRARLAHDQG